MVKDMINNVSESYSIFRKGGKTKKKNNAFSMFPFTGSPKTVKIKIYC